MSTKSSTPWEKSVYNEQEFYDAWEASWKKTSRFFYANLVRQTLSGAHKYLLKPDQVFYVGQYPMAYVMSVDKEPTPDEVGKWKRFLWNQSVVPILIVVISKRNIHVYTANEYKGDFPKTLTVTADALDRLKTEIESGAFFGTHSDRFERKQAVDSYLLKNLHDATTGLWKTLLSKSEKNLVEKIDLQGGTAQDSDIKKVDAIRKKHQEFVQLFLTRILFICYLIDRGMLKGEHFPKESPFRKIAPTDVKKPHRLVNVLQECRTVEERRNAIKQVFEVTKTRFNGSLFDYGSNTNDCDAINVSGEFLNTLTAFLGGRRIKEGQPAFDFMSYDFNVIPIETISAIYESFLGTQGVQRTSGAYYTPPHLAELVVDIALEELNDQKIYEKKVFDPSCGSGVFLVSLFCRMADQLRYDTKYKSKNHSPAWGRKILGLLKRIYGIDSNSTACHIACFSLYLAALEQLKPTDLDRLTDAILPPLLFDPEKGHTKGENIIKANFFDSTLPIDGQTFDLIVGNPPWVSREQQKDPVFLNWEKKNSESMPTPEHQIAYGFLWKAKQYLDITGTSCLLVPASVLWSTHTDTFLKKWLKQTTIDRVVNFSDLRRVLFENAIHPCVAIRFVGGYMDEMDRKICYESPKTDNRSQVGGPVYVREEDRTCLFQKNVIAGAEIGRSVMVWKVPFWGKGRDQQLIERLNVMPKLRDLTSEPNSKSRTLFIKGQGCQPYSPNDEKQGRRWYKPWWKQQEETMQLPFLNARANFDLLVTEKDFSDIPETLLDKLRTSPDRRLFELPKVIVNHGFTKAAFCPKPVLFQHALQSFAALHEHEDSLRFLSVLFMSRFIRYYLFHTSENWGSERDKVHLDDELLFIPFFLPNMAPKPSDAVENMNRIISTFRRYEQKIKVAIESLKKNRLDNFDFVLETKKVRDECEPFVRRYYGINRFEEHLIDDTIQYIIPSITPTSASSQVPALNHVKAEQCQAYVHELLDMFKAFAWKEEDYPYSAHIYLPGTNDQYGIIRIDRSYDKEKKITTSKEDKDLQKAIQRISKHLDQRESDHIFHCVNLKVFDGDSLFILKPIQLRFWTRIAAQNDADEIGGHIAQQLWRDK